MALFYFCLCALRKNSQCIVISLNMHICSYYDYSGFFVHLFLVFEPNYNVNYSTSTSVELVIFACHVFFGIGHFVAVHKTYYNYTWWSTSLSANFLIWHFLTPIIHLILFLSILMDFHFSSKRNFLFTKSKENIICFLFADTSKWSSSC